MIKLYRLSIAYSALLFLSCSDFNQSIDNTYVINSKDDLKSWVLNNKDLLTKDSDSIIADYISREKIDSNWYSSTIVITKHSSNSLGMLAKRVSDSSDCIATSLTFYRDPKLKSRIYITATDSSCLTPLKSIVLLEDSTDSFIYGKEY